MNAIAEFLTRRDSWGWPRWMFGLAVVLGLAVYFLLWPILEQFGWPFWAKLFAIAACGALIGWVGMRLLRRFRGPPGDDSG
jgi:hypothetical protein